MDRASVGHADGLLETSAEFMRRRPRLLGIAYRVVGDMAEAEDLSPVERAAFVLREAFDYPYSKIAGMLELSQPNARQVVSRARRRLHVERNAPVDGMEHQHLLSAFLAAAQWGRVTALERVLTTDRGWPPPEPPRRT
ncbi:sigma factor-like helix-turn-helix DNA-binding protein [Streptomyces sp. NPDC086010]|uniref:sigma factor-like helix-turn-helix DNA-binding protein n=1 Tax=Streptomyces sp. NPDC086010 TaxID=3365745 RepID=UPI0037D1E9BA